MNKRKIIWGVVSFFIAAFTIWAICSQTKNFSLQDFGEFILQADKPWLFLALVCMFFYIGFEGIAIVRTANSLGYKKSIKRGYVYGAADVYFSAITPSASGGQPASAFFMIRDGIPAMTVTAILLINLIMYTLGLFTLGIASLIFRFDIFMNFSIISKIFIVIGFTVLLVLSGMFYIMLTRARILYYLLDRCLYFLEKIHLVRHGERKRKRFKKTMNDYQQCSESIRGHSKLVIEVFFWNVMQRIAQFGIVFMVFMSKGLGVNQAITAFVTQCFVSVGSNCVPIPGSMGVADFLMLDGYSLTMSKVDATNMELLCRSISFYGCIIISGIIVLAAFIKQRMKKKC